MKIMNEKNMLSRGIMSLSWLLLSASVYGGGFPEDFQRAVKLYDTGKGGEAEAAFVQLYERKSNQRAMDESMARAADCAMLQGKTDQALAYVDKIKEACLSKFCRMKLLMARKKPDELISRFKDEDLGKWPDSLAYAAFSCRGRAYSNLKDTKNAEKDFLAAIASTIEARNKALVYLLIGNLYDSVDKNDQKALAAYAEVVKIMSNPKPSMRGGLMGRALGARAKLLSYQGKRQEALAELERLGKLDLKGGYWPCVLQLWYGEVYEIMKENNEALESYRKAATIADAPKEFVEIANRKISDLEKLTQK